MSPAIAELQSSHGSHEGMLVLERSHERRKRPRILESSQIAERVGARDGALLFVGDECEKSLDGSVLPFSRGNESFGAPEDLLPVRAFRIPRIESSDGPLRGLVFVAKVTSIGDAERRAPMETPTWISMSPTT